MASRKGLKHLTYVYYYSVIRLGICKPYIAFPNLYIRIERKRFPCIASWHVTLRETIYFYFESQVYECCDICRHIHCNASML